MKKLLVLVIIGITLISCSRYKYSIQDEYLQLSLSDYFNERSQLYFTIKLKDFYEKDKYIFIDPIDIPDSIKCKHIILAKELVNKRTIS